MASLLVSPNCSVQRPLQLFSCNGKETSEGSQSFGIGKWNLTIQEKLEKNFQAPSALPAVEQNLIPQKDDTFVKFGNFNDIRKIIQSRIFYPTFITGLSGNGKTLSVEQGHCNVG